MSDTPSTVPDGRLDRLRAADPFGFAAAVAMAEVAGAAMPRPGDKESGPAPVFRPGLPPSPDP